MEESKTTSEFIYEDDFSFVTEEGELFLKDSSYLEKKKLCDVDEDEAEQKVGRLKEAFEDLEQRIQALENQEELKQNKIDELRETLKNAQAIGDFDALFERLANFEKKIGQEETPEEQKNGKASLGNEQAESGQEPESVQQSGDDEQQQENSQEIDSITYYRDIVKKADSLSSQTDWSYVTMELDNLSRQWSEGPDLEKDKVGKLYKKFIDKVETFENRKKEHYEKLDKQKKRNLSRKKELLSQLKDIIKEEQWTATGKVGSLKRKWNAVGTLPSGKGEGLDEEFEELIRTFNDHKVDRLVQQRQKQEDNLMLKLIILDKMENVANSIDSSTTGWKKIDNTFDDLTRQWKKIGRVPKEKSNEVWQRYKSAQDTYYNKKYEYDKKHRKRVDKFKSKKEKIIGEAEVLLEAKDLATAARKINKLHRRWKKAGNLPQRLEDELWDRFKSATDAFNERKSQNVDKLHEQEEEHYRQKLELIDKANAIKETDDFEKGHSQMQSLMDRWKKVGPVARKKSNKIWKQFKGAMDEFYDRRREHFKEVKEERKENLKEKQEILDKLRELGQHEDPIEAVNIAKDLQEKFKNAGYVPIKQKNKMWKEYREACDVIYDRFRAAKSGNKFDQELAKASLDTDDRSRIQNMRKQYKKIQKDVRQLEKEIVKYKETKTYFKPTNKGNALRDEIQQKIDNAEDKLLEKQEKLDFLTKEMEDIKAEA